MTPRAPDLTRGSAIYLFPPIVGGLVLIGSVIAFVTAGAALLVARRDVT